MAITFVAKADKEFDGTTNPVFNVPTGTQDGDLMVFLAPFKSNSGSMTWTQSSWVKQYDDQTDNLNSIEIFTRVASSEPASYTFTTSGASIEMYGGIVTFRGADTTTPFLAASTRNTGTGTSLTANSPSWATASDAVSIILVKHRTTASTPTWPTGWSSSSNGGFEGDDTSVGGNEFSKVAVNLTTNSAVTSLPSQSITYGTSETWVTVQIALKVASADQPRPYHTDVNPLPFVPQGRNY